MSIGGALDYQKLANLNRPQSIEALTAEVKRLHGLGLSALDISVALRVGIDSVREMLAAQP